MASDINTKPQRNYLIFIVKFILTQIILSSKIKGIRISK